MKILWRNTVVWSHEGCLHTHLKCVWKVPGLFHLVSVTIIVDFFFNFLNSIVIGIKAWKPDSIFSSSMYFLPFFPSFLTPPSSKMLLLCGDCNTALYAHLSEIAEPHPNKPSILFFRHHLNFIFIYCFLAHKITFLRTSNIAPPIWNEKTERKLNSGRCKQLSCTLP